MNDPAAPAAPNRLPVVGHAPAFAREPFAALERWAEHGSVVRLEFPGERFYLVSDPEIVATVFRDGERRFTIADQQRRAFADVEDRAVSTAVGDRWRRLRGALRPAFTREAVERCAEGIVERTIARTETWTDGEEIDLHREMRLLTLEILAETLLDLDLRGDEDAVLAATDALVARSDPRRLGAALPEWMPTPTDRRFRRTVRDLESVVERALETPRGEGENARTVLLEAHEASELTDREVRDNLVALLLAGTDTSALALTYGWYLLSQRPAVRRSLVAAYDDHVGSGRPSLGNFDGLEEVERVVRETLRLYPPTWNTMRQSTESVVLGGHRLPEGAQFMLPQWVFHRDERFWEAPTAFRPSRWIDESDRPEYAYFPFGGGPRHCIGARFARLELRLALAAMVGRVDLDVSVPEPLSFVPTLSLRPAVELSATVHHR
jgi:cytochrome P450